MKKSAMIVAAALAALAARAADPVAPYNNYGPAMASTAEKPLTSEWQKQQAEAIAAATSDDALAAIASRPAAAEALLAKVRGAYETDALTLTQIAAVTQWVMRRDAWWTPVCFWTVSHAEGRKVWVRALLKQAETAQDAYVKTFCLDQLRWCACPCPALPARVRALADASKDAGVKAMASMVLRAVSAR
jgi:hypothetical protein